jgi:tetratricopeptide (TPR) repeat protein
MRAAIRRASIILIIIFLGSTCRAPALAGQGRATQKRQPRTSADKRLTPQQQAEFNKLSKQADAARESASLPDAIRLYNQALRLKPTWVDGWWYLGSIFYTLDRYSEASEALRILLSLKKDNGPAWALLGLCEFQLRNYDQALADIQYGSRLGLGENKPFIDVARFHGAILMTRAGQFELGYDTLRPFAREGNESMKVIEAFGINALRMPLLPVELPPDRRELVLLAGRAAFYHAGRYPQKADRAFKELLARYPDAPNANYAYGVFLLIDTPDAALDAFRRELQISPTSVVAMLQIAFEYIKRNDFEQAKPYAEKAVETAPELFATHNALGRVSLGLGNIDGAIRELEIGVKQAPDSPEMRFALARAYTRAGRKEDAARERAIFLQLDKQVRQMRDGTQSVGGVEAKPTDKNPPQ